MLLSQSKANDILKTKGGNVVKVIRKTKDSVIIKPIDSTAHITVPLNQPDELELLTDFKEPTVVSIVKELVAKGVKRDVLIKELVDRTGRTEENIRNYLGCKLSEWRLKGILKEGEDVLSFK